MKTTYILQYCHDDALRDRVHRQLNRGESRHQLARRLFFANQGAFRRGDYAEIMNKVSALSLLSNAALTWNTVHIGKLVFRRNFGLTQNSRQVCQVGRFKLGSGEQRNRKYGQGLDQGYRNWVAVSSMPVNVGVADE